MIKLLAPGIPTCAALTLAVLAHCTPLPPCLDTYYTSIYSIFFVGLRTTRTRPTLRPHSYLLRYNNGCCLYYYLLWHHVLPTNSRPHYHHAALQCFTSYTHAVTLLASSRPSALPYFQPSCFRLSPLPLSTALYVPLLHRAGLLITTLRLLPLVQI